MSTQPGNVLTQVDPAVQLTVAGTQYGAAQSKGTCTDLLVTISEGAFTASLGGSITPVVEGSDVTNSAASNWAVVQPDSVGGVAVTGQTNTALSAMTASGYQTAHYAQLQYQFYRLGVSASANATGQFAVNWAFMPVEDTADLTQSGGLVTP